MQVETGEILPVDGITYHSDSIVADESNVTGESDDKPKGIPVTYAADEKIDPFIISGSKINDGSGYILVCAVGIHSELG